MTRIFSSSGASLHPLSGKKHASRVLDGGAWLMHVLGIHEAARKSLARTGRANDLLPRNAAYFQDLLAGKIGHMVGTFVDGCLAAQCAVVLATSGEEAKRNGTLSCPESLLKTAGIWEAPFSVVGALAVDPVRQGRRLALETLAYAYKVSHDQLSGNSPRIVAQVALGNRCSMKKFFEAGCCLEAAWGEKPKDGQGKVSAKGLFCSMPKSERDIQVILHALCTKDMDGASRSDIAQALRSGLRIVPFREGDKCRLAFCERKPIAG